MKEDKFLEPTAGPLAHSNRSINGTITGLVVSLGSKHSSLVSRASMAFAVKKDLGSSLSHANS